MLSGPGVLPVFKNSKTVSTSYGVNWIQLSILSLWDIMGSGVLLSSKVFCSQKKIIYEFSFIFSYRNK